MRIHRRYFTFAASLLAVGSALILSPFLWSQEKPAKLHDSRSANSAGDRADKTHSQFADKDHAAIKVASAGTEDNSLRKLAGKGVRTDAGDRLGTLKDFVVDTSTGHLVYGVISGGGFMGARDTLRAVPADALQASSAFDGFVVDLEMAKWSQTPVLNEQDFDDGRVNISVDQHQQLNQLFEIKTAQSVASAGSGSLQLQRASEIRGKAIHAGRQKVGDIEEIVIDWDKRTAHALVDPNDDFTGSDDKFLVPLSRLNLASRDDTVTAVLTRADFAQAESGTQNVTGVAAAQSAGATESGSATTIKQEATLSPTGITGVEQPPHADPKLVEAARAIRLAIDQDAALKEENIQVNPGEGKLILSGSVTASDAKSNAEQIARKAATSTQIDNQISIEAQNQAK